jgi:TolB protein
MKRAFLFFLMLACLASAQRSLDLGTISRLGVAKTVPVYWDTKCGTLAPLIDRALGMNGGLLKVSPDAANVLLEFREISGGKVELVLLGTKPKRVLYEEQFQGGRPGYLALEACNRAVEKILGIPGFYTGKIAFISDRTGHDELYISDLFFQNIRQITNDKALAASPRLSPDGRAINYTGYYRSGYPDLYRVDLSSGRRTTIAGFRGLNTGGSWSPKGDLIALVLSSSGNPEIYLSDPQGGKFRRLTHTPAIEAGPSFSPDCGRVVFASDLPGKPQLYVMDVTGGPMRRLATNISNYCAEPVWNPRDPNQIAFTAGVGSGFQVALYDFTKHTSKILTHEAGDAVEPTWLNDGRHLIYTARTSGTRQLTVLDTETDKATPLNSFKFGRAYQASFAK